MHLWEEHNFNLWCTDLYTFDQTEEDALHTYELVCECYERIFKQLNLPILKGLYAVQFRCCLTQIVVSLKFLCMPVMCSEPTCEPCMCLLYRTASLVKPLQLCTYVCTFNRRWCSVTRMAAIFFQLKIMTNRWPAVISFTPPVVITLTSLSR